MTNPSDFLVRTPNRVLNYLTDLVRHKCIMSAHFGRHNASFLTTIVGLDPKNNILQLDCGPTAVLDNQLLASEKVLFRTEIGGVKVSFNGQRIQKVKAGSEWVLSMPIPEVIFWMERRQFHRVKIPLSHTDSYCQLTFSDDNPDHGGHTTRFALYDMSVGGFSFLNPEPDWAQYLRPEREFADSILNLQDGSQARAAFVIKNNVDMRVSSLCVQQRIGCQFSYLPPNVDSLLQRYIHSIDIQHKNIA